MISEAEINRILFADRHQLEKLDSAKVEKLYLNWCKDLLFTHNEIDARGSVDFLFFRSLSRDDYKVFLHDVAGVLSGNSVRIVEDYQIRKREVNNLALACLREYSHLKELIRAKSERVADALLVRLCKYLVVWEQLKTLNAKCVVFFADMQPVEHLLSIYFRGVGLKTVTLQHGLYVNYSDLDTVNVINYLHQPSEYFLSWGEHTAQMIGTYHPKNKQIICGKPRISVVKETEEKGKSKEYVSLVLDQVLFDDENIELIDIVEKFCLDSSYRLNIRCHPSKTAERYELFPKDCLLDQPLENSEFVIGHTSSLIYECLSAGVKALRYKTRRPAIDLPENLQFCNLHELKEVAKNINRYQGREFIDCIGEEAGSKYRKALMSIMGDESIELNTDVDDFIPCVSEDNKYNSKIRVDFNTNKSVGKARMGFSPAKKLILFFCNKSVSERIKRDFSSELTIKEDDFSFAFVDPSLAITTENRLTVSRLGISTFLQCLFGSPDMIVCFNTPMEVPSVFANSDVKLVSSMGEVKKILKNLKNRR